MLPALRLAWQCSLEKILYPTDALFDVFGRAFLTAGTQRYQPLAAIAWITLFAEPAVTLQIGYGAAHSRDGNACNLVKGGHGTESSFQVTSNDLIHNAQLVERRLASVLL